MATIRSFLPIGLFIGDNRIVAPHFGQCRFGQWQDYAPDILGKDEPLFGNVPFVPNL